MLLGPGGEFGTGLGSGLGLGLGLGLGFRCCVLGLGPSSPSRRGPTHGKQRELGANLGLGLELGLELGLGLGFDLPIDSIEDHPYMELLLELPRYTH